MGQREREAADSSGPPSAWCCHFIGEDAEAQRGRGLAAAQPLCCEPPRQCRAAWPPRSTPFSPLSRAALN